MAQVLSDSVRVELGLGSTPLTALSAVTWTDVTGSVMLGSGLSFNRGRSGYDSSARPGTCSFTLDNSKQKGTEGRFSIGGVNDLAGFGLRIPVRVRSRYPYFSNLISNSSFEAGSTAYWGASAGTSFTGSTTRAYTGGYSGLITWATGAAGGQYAYQGITTLVVGRTYTFSCWAYVPTGSPDIYCLEGGALGGSAVMTTKNAWTRMSFSFTATGSTHFFLIPNYTSATAGQTAYIDAVLLEEGSTASTWRENLVSNSSFETDTTGWFGQGSATISRDTSRSYTGTAAGLVTWATGTASTESALIPCATITGKQYTVSLYVYVPTGAPNVAATCNGVGTGTTSTVKDTWTRITFTFTATATTSNVGVRNQTAATAGQTVYIDGVVLEDGASASDLTAFPASGEPVDLWYGYIESVEMDWDNGYRPVVRVQATDRLGRLQRRQLQGLVLGEQLVDGPAALWPMDEANGSLTVGDRSNATGVPSMARTANGAVTTSDFNLGLGAGPGPDGLFSAVFTPQTTAIGYYLNGTAFPVVVGHGAPTNPAYGTLECYFYVSALGTGSSLAMMTDSGSPTLGMFISGDKLAMLMGSLVYGVSQTTVGPSVGTTTVTAGTWHHAAMTWSYTPASDQTTWLLYLDGVQEAASAQSGQAWGLTIPAAGRPISTGSMLNGRMANMAYYKTVLDSTAIARHASARTSFTGELAGDRFKRICRLAGQASTEYTVVGTTLATMGAQPIKGATLLDAVNEAAEAEVGVSYLNRSGQLALSSRASRYNAIASFDLPAGSVGKNTGFVVDMSAIINDVTISRVNGITSRAVNTASVTAYDTHDYTSSVYLDTDQQVIDTATWYANFNAIPKPRVTDINIDVVTQANPLGTELSAILAADVGTMFSVSGLPAASSPATTLYLFVEGVTDRITATSWERSFVASPSANTAAGILDSAVFAQLDSTAVLAF